MCKHKYEIELFQAPKTCYLQQVYVDYYDELGKLKLPLDEEGYCLFHSTNEEWKLENKFEIHLQRILHLMLEVNEFKDVDLRGIEVVSKSEKGIEWKGMTTIKPLNLCSAQFHTSLTFDHCHFGGELYLDKANILGVWSVENTVFSTNFTAIQGTVFQSNVYMKEVIFYDLFDMQDVMFLGQINLNAVTFNGYANWDRAVFNSEKNSFSYFQFNIGSNANATFRETEFHNIVQFENCVFEGDTQFVETLFKKGVFITKPKIKANVSFRGKSEEERMFQDEVEMTIGRYSFHNAAQLIFENTDLTLLDNKTKTKLTDLKANRLIVLGKGTIVFRVSLEERYRYSELDEIFIHDLLQTIRQYFKQKLKKYFEIILTREEDDLIVTFVTDDFKDANEFQKAKDKLIEELATKMGSEVQDAVENYLHHKFENQIQTTIQHTIEQNIAPKLIQGILGKDNLKIVLNSPQVNKIHAQTLTIGEVRNSNFYIEKLAGMQNEPVFKMNDVQFNELKLQLSNINDDKKWTELKELLTAIQKDVVAPNELIPFLGECGVSIGNNLSAGIIFIFLQYLLMGGG